MRGFAAVLIYSGCWAGFGVASGWIASRVPPRHLQHDRGPLRLRAFEGDGSWYRRHLHIQRWKGRLPEAGTLFGGASKAALRSRSVDALDRFAIETRRAEWVHWANLVFGFTFLAWTPWPVALVMIVFGIVVHTPFIVVQRSNRARLGRLRGRRTETAPRWSRRRRIVVGVAAVTIVGSAVTLAVLAPDPAREVTVDEARARLDSDPRGVTDEPGRADLPAPGVYRYRGEGTESLDKPPVSQRQGPEMPGTVVHRGDGCWSFRIDYSTKHSQTWDLCREGDDIVEVGGSSSQKLDLRVIEVSVTSESVCDPVTVLRSTTARSSDGPVAQGCTTTLSSADEPVRVEGPAEFVGIEDVRIGSEVVHACHHRHVRTMTGGQTGSEELDLWLDCRTGLPLRNERRVSARTGSPLGTIAYTEQGSFELVDVRPEAGR